MGDVVTGYRLAKDGQALVSRLQLLDQFRHTRQARIVCLFSDTPVTLGGHPKRAIIGEPRVQGPWRGIFEAAVADLCAPIVGEASPEFVILISAGYWNTADKPARERLIFHELCHLQQKTGEFGELRSHDDGRPLLTTVPHDVESFTTEVERYGPDTAEAAFLYAAQASLERRTRSTRKHAS